VHPLVDGRLGGGQRLERRDVVEELPAQGLVEPVDLAGRGRRPGLVSRWVMPFSRHTRSKTTSTG
jgi:hypothetical protein